MSDGHWNPAADLSYAAKQEVIRDYFDRYKPGVVIETGLYAGRGSCVEFADRAAVVVIDPDEANIRNMPPDVFACLGDSATVLPIVLAKRVYQKWFDKPALFWLDAHVVTENLYDNHSPLREELDAILAWPHAAASVVLIDDVRMMGLPGWPTREEVEHACAAMWDVRVVDDIMRCVPR